MSHFPFDRDKAIASVLYILQKIGKADFHKIFKLLYWADQEHLMKYGRPVVGDVYIAMKNGPVPSEIYNKLKSLNGMFETGPFKNKVKIVDNYCVIPLTTPDMDEFSVSDIEALDQSIDNNRTLDYNQRTEKSHQLAWKDAYPNKQMSNILIACEAGANENMKEYIMDLASDYALAD